MLNSELKAVMRTIKWERPDVSFRLKMECLDNEVFKLFGLHCLDETRGNGEFKLNEYRKNLERHTVNLGRAFSFIESVWVSSKGRVATNMQHHTELESLYKYPQNVRENDICVHLFTSIENIVKAYDPSIHKSARIAMDRLACTGALAAYPDGLYIVFSDSDEDSVETDVNEAPEKK